MSAGFNQLLEFCPVPRRVLLRLLAGIVALAVVAVMLSDLPWWGHVIAIAFVGVAVVLEFRQLGLTPRALRRLPDGVWLAYPESTNSDGHEEKPTKCILERHFFAGNGSIGVLFRDSRDRKVAVWLLKNTCSDSEWRRLRVLLRWPDAGSGQDAW
jgi:hypothetical protein